MRLNLPFSLNATGRGVVVLLFATSSFAQQLTMTRTGTGSGTLAGTPFTNASFTITDVANTANRVPYSSGFTDVDTLASVAITGVGSFTFVTPTRAFVNNSNLIVGFSQSPSGTDLFDGPTDASFATWDMLTGIGPITGTGTLMQWSNSPINTSGGILVFNNFSSSTTFTAMLAAIPEPAACAALAGLGVLGFAVYRTRHRRAP